MWIPALCLVVVILAFFFVVFFRNPNLTPDQRTILILLFALLAGLSTFFLGGSAFLEVMGEGKDGIKWGFSATAGVAVFALCYLISPHTPRQPTDAPAIPSESATTSNGSITKSSTVEQVSLSVAVATPSTESAPTPKVITRGELTEVITLIGRQQSVNIVVPDGIKQEKIAADLIALKPGIPMIDLEDPCTTSRHGLLSEMMRLFEVKVSLPKTKPNDLPEFGRQMQRLKSKLLIFVHADRFGDPKRRTEYQTDLFHALKHYASDNKKLTIVFVSRKPFSQLLPPNHELSHIPVTTVQIEDQS